MKKKIKFGLLTLLFLGMALAGMLYLFYGDIAVLNPKGIVALEESNLIITSTLLMRSEEHTSELQSQFHLVCRLLLEKKKYNKKKQHTHRQAFTKKKILVTQQL